MAKKTAKKRAKKSTTTKSKGTKQTPADKLTKALTKVGQPGHQLVATDFGRGQQGYSMHLHGHDGRALLTVDLIEKDDGTWRLKTELTHWLLEEIEKAGFTIAERKKPQKKKRPPKKAQRRSNEEREGIIKFRSDD